MARSQKKLQILDGICLDVWKLKPPSLHVGFIYGKKTLCQNSDKFCGSFIKNYTIFMFYYIYFIFTENPLFQAYLKLIH